MDRLPILRSLLDPTRPGLELIPPGGVSRLEGEAFAAAERLELEMGARGLGRPCRRASMDWIALPDGFTGIADPLGLLAECELWLRPGGVLAVALPDDRAQESRPRCARAGEVLEAHLDPRGTPPAWRFTPAGFRLLMLHLEQLGVLRLRERSFIPTRGGFVMSLSAAAPGCPISRSTLVRLLEIELRPQPLPAAVA